MQTPFDSFALHFDSIPVEPKRPGEPAPTRGEEEHADAAPRTGFTLIDDADGRFAIDRDTGVITLLQDDLLTREAGALHPVHMRVVEPSGARYELQFKLRMTGLVPQIAGAEEFDALASMVVGAAQPKPAPAISITPPQARPIASPWARLTRGGEDAPFGVLCEAPLPALNSAAGELSLGAAPPRPGAASAIWAI